MMRKSIVTMVVTLGIVGAASLVWAAPPSATEAGQQDTDRATVSGAFDDDPCVSSFFNAEALHNVIHTSGEGNDLFEVERARLLLSYFDHETGILLTSSTSNPFPEASSIDLDGVTVLDEFEAQRYQCDPDPTCGAPPTNCTFVATESVLVDLTWEGIGDIETTKSNTVLHGDHDDFIVNHAHVISRRRAALVSGVISISLGDSDLDFEIDDFGLLTELIVQSNFVGEPECEGGDC